MSVGVAASVPNTSRGVALRINFPGRRYHATPWGHHVNEGLIEWPPSPWRLLRGFLATGYTKLRWPKEGPPTTAISLLEKLATELPRFLLPRAVGTHSRHYMPLARFKGGREETTMVLDTWAQIDNGSIDAYWDIEITPDEKALLASLARELGYLGRSESWVDASLLSDASPSDFDVRPGEARDRPGAGWEQVSLLAALPPADYRVWRERAVHDARAALPNVNAKGKPLSKPQQTRQLEETDASFPTDVIACLQVDTAWLQELGWNQPPGTRKVLYWRRTSSLETAAPRSGAWTATPPPVDLMLLAMATPTGNLHALPPITRTLPQGELLHQALLSHSNKGGEPHGVLSGRDRNGNPRRGGEAHIHAHLLHLDLDDDGHLDHALIWGPRGLEAEVQRVIRAVRRTFAKGVDPLKLALAAAGSHRDLCALPSPLGDRLRAVLGGVGGSRYFRSITPFVPPRYLKPRGSNSLEGQITAELRARGFPDAVSIQRISLDADDDFLRRSRHFVRRRTRRAAPQPPLDCGFLLELEFAEPMCGPIALGYGSHFGLGLFSAPLP